MTNSEWDQLLRSLTKATVESNAPPAAHLELPALPTTATMPAPRVEDLAKALAPREDVSSMEPSSATQATDGGSIAGTVLKTVGLATGVGPLVTGLLKIFGGGSGDKPGVEYAGSTYLAPPPVDVEAGLAADRSISSVVYGQGNTPRSGATTAPASQIQINVQAMDSRSFLDHSDEIARAVREAMLHSHSLNDVVAEI